MLENCESGISLNQSKGLSKVVRQNHESVQNLGAQSNGKKHILWILTFKGENSFLEKKVTKKIYCSAH